MGFQTSSIVPILYTGSGLPRGTPKKKTQSSDKQPFQTLRKLIPWSGGMRVSNHAESSELLLLMGAGIRMWMARVRLAISDFHQLGQKRCHKHMFFILVCANAWAISE